MFERQIEQGGPVTVTHPDMTRYFMSLSEAVSLIIQAGALTKGDDIFLLDMGQQIRIDDLARRLIRLRGLRPEVDIPIVYTGVRPGEKMHEELLNEEEVRRAREIDKYFVVVPAFGTNGHRQYQYPGMEQHAVERAYSSNLEAPISLSEIQTLLRRSGLLKEPG